MKWLQKWGENDNLLAKWTDKNMSTLQNSTSISSYCWLYIWRGYLGLHHTCMYHPIKINKLSQFSVSSLIPKKYDAMEISQLEAPPLHWLNKRNVCMTRDVNLDGSSGGCWLYFTLSLLMGKKSPNPKLRIGATSLKKRLHPHVQQLARDAIWVGVMIFWPSICGKADSEPVLPQAHKKCFNANVPCQKNWPFPGHPNIQNVGPGNALSYPFTNKWVRLPW